MPNPLDTLYDQLKGQYPDLVDRSEFIGKLSNEDELKKLHDAASKDIPGFVDFDNFKSKVGESLSTYDQDSDYKAQSAPAEQESAPTDITIPRREKGRHVPSEPQNGGISSEAYVPTEPGQPIDTRVDTEAFDRETGDLDELDRRYQEKVKRLEGYGREPNLYVNEDEARKHYEAYSRLFNEAEQDRLVYNRRVKAADDERAEQQRQLDLQSKDRKTRRSAEYGGYTNDQVRKEQERLKKERAYLEDPKSKRKADYSKRVMEYNADQTALSGEADKRNKRAESKRAMYDEVRKVAEDPDVQKRITGNDTTAYVLSGNNPYALQNYDAARERAKTMSDEELVDTCKNIAGQKYARGDNKDIYAPLAAAFMAYHNELMYRLGGDEPKSALEMRYDMIDKATESSPEGDNFMLTLRNYLDGTAGMGTANFENDQSERANIPQFAVVDYYNALVAQKEDENMTKVEQIARYPQQEGVTDENMAAAANDISYDKLLEQAFERFGDANLKAYITAYALRNGISIDEAARRVNQSIWDETIGKTLEGYRPKSGFEFFVRRIFSDNMFAKLGQLGLRARNGTLGTTDPFAMSSMALDEYAKDHPVWDTAAVVTNFAVMEGPIFSAYGKLAGGLVGATERAIIGAATKTAEKTAIESSVRALNQSFWYRLAKGVPTGGLVGFQYGTMSGAIDQAYYDGNVDFGKVIANGGHMTRDFAIIHGVGELFGVTGDAILRRGQRNLRNGQGVLRNRLETTSLHFLNNVAKTTANASIVTGLYAAIDKPALERENKKIEAENKKIEAENARLPEDKQKPLKPLNQIASVEDTFYSSLRMFAGLDAVGMLRSAWGIGVRGQYERNKHVKVHFDKFDREALEKAFGKNPNSLLRQIVFGNVDGVPAKWFEIDPEAEQEIYKELGRELTPAEKEAYATYGFTELRKIILNKDIPWATRAKIVSVITGQIVQEPPVAKGDIQFEMDSSGTQIKRIIVKSLDLEGNVIQINEFSGKEFEAARRLVESLNDRGWRNNALLCGNLVIDAIEDKTYADTVDEMAREKGIAPDQFEQMVFGIKQKDITGEKVTYQERQLVDEFDKRHQQKQQAETELAGPNKLFEQVAREVFGAEWKRALNIPSKSWGEMSEAEKEFVNKYIDRIGAMGVAERNKLMNSNPDWARAAKEYEESVRRRMAEAERPAEAEPLPNLEDEKVSVEVPAEERVEPVPEVIELEEEKPVQEPPVQEQDDADAYEDAINKLADEIIHNPKDVAVFRGRKDIADSHFSPRVESLKKQNPNALKDLYARINEILFDLLDKAQREQLIGGLKEVMNQEEYDALFAEEKPDTEGQPQAGTIGFEPVEQPTERERFDAERKEKAATITDADIEANREALGIPEGTALSDEARQIYAEDLAEDLMRYERFKRGESDEKARFHDYWESKFNPKRPKLEKPAEKQEEPVGEEEFEEEEEEVTDADAQIEQFDNLKGRSDLEKYRNALKVFAGDDEIMDILEDLEPHDITEWVSSFLGLDSGKGYSMLWESKTRGGTVIAIGFKEETGWSWNDVKGFAFMFDNKNGMSPRRVAEKIWEALPSGMKNQYSDVDVFNIMMDLFKSSSRKSDLTNYIRNNRMEQVRELLNRRRSDELADIARYKERMSRGEEEPVTEPVTTDDSDNEFAVREDEVAPFSLLSLNYRQGEVEGGTVRSRARTRKQIGTIAKALGYKIRWVADKSYNAKIDTDEKVLYLNIRTDQPLAAVMGHEVTHDLRKSDPKAYEALKRYAQDLLGQEQWDNEVKDVTDVYNEEYKRRGWEPIRADKAEEEVVCDTMGKLLHSRKGLRELAGSLDPGVAGKVYRLMKDITDKIKSALGKEHNYDTMDSALQEFLEAVEQRAKKGDIATIQNTPAEGEATIDLSLRRKPAPKKVRKVYKLMRLKMSEDGKTLGEDGKVYPLYIDSGTGLDLKNWYDADSPAFDKLRELDKGYWLYDLTTGEAEKADKPSREQIAEADAQGKRYMVIRDVYDDVYDKYNKDKENWEASQRGEKKWKKKKPFIPLTPEQLEKKAVKAQKDAEKRYSDTRRYYNIGLNGSGDVGEYALRPGWHAGSHPTMRQIGKGKNKNLRDDTFVWVEGYVPDDVEYQTEAEGNIDKDIPTHIPTDGHYLMLTNPNAKAAQADRVGWYVAGAFRPERILSDWEARQVIDEWNAAHPNDKIEYDFERESGRVFNAETMQLEEPGSEGAKQGIHRDPSGGYSVTDKAEIESLAPRMDGESEADYTERIGEIEADEKAFVEGDGQFSLKKEDSMRDNSVKYFEEYHVRGNKDRKYGPLRRNSITRQALDKANEMIAEMRDYIAPWYDREAGGNRYLPEEVYGLSTIFDNASYGATLENTLICTRTLAYNDFCDSVKRKLGRPLTKRESFLASQMLYDIATDPQCLYCYVSLDRKAYDEYLLRYFDERDAVIERYNKMSDKSAENIDALYKTFLDGRKDTYQMRSRFNSWLMLADHDSAIGRDKVALSADRKNALAQESNEEAAVRWREITKQYNRLRGEEKKKFKESKEYLDALHAYLATEQGQIKDACAYAQGASWAKKEAEYRSYTGELLRTTKRMLGGLASHYGLRFYSFSEYSPAFILENMQMIRDAALRGLKGFAYTKEIDFCKIFLPTGININCSTYGRRNAAGEIVMDERQGANWDEARALRDQYENMGIVFVATDDEMVRWAKEQPWIDVIIPFHIVRTGADIAEFYGWTNYTNVSADYDAQGRHKDIMPPEHNNSIEDYDRLVAERGLTRRFPQFYDGPGDQNYMKLINETRRKASDTPILTPVFNMEEAKKSFDKFVEKGGYWGGFYEVGADDVVRAVDEVAADIEAGKSAGEVEYGRQDIDFDSAMANLEKTRRRINRNREHGNTPKTSFSLKRDEERTLMGVHNITTEKLRSALKLGGLANPSMAVIDTKVGGFDNFGEISLIPGSDLIASRTGRNAGTWGADAYSPRFPETHRRLGKGGDKKMRSWVKGLGMRQEMEHNTEEQFNDYYNGFNIRDNALVYPFLHEKGLSDQVDYYTHKNVDARLEDDLREANGDQFVLLKRFDEDDEYKKKLTDIVVGDEVKNISKRDGETFQQFRDRRREWAKEIRETLTEEDGFINRNLAEDLLYAQARAYRENGKFNESYTHTNAEKYIRDHGMQDEYQQYFEQKMQELGAETQVYAGSDSMGRSKFKPIDLESVSKQMKKQGRAGGEGGIFEDSPGAIRAKLLNPMKTLDQIRKEKGRIVSHDEFEQAREEYQDRLRDYADTYANGSIGALADILTSRDMAETARRYNKDLDAGDLYDLNEFKDYIKKLPTEYFETKFERPVGLEEFKKAVVPDNLPLDLYGALERAGLEIVEYPAGDREERQRVTLDAVKGEQDVMFSLMGRRGAERLDALDNGRRIADLDVAEEMEKADKDARTIKLATGWERGADGKWRHEEPDGDFVDKGINVEYAEQHRLKLSDIWDSPELFKAYPEFAEIPVEIVNNPLGASATTQVDRSYEMPEFEVYEKFIRDYDQWLEDKKRRRDEYRERLSSSQDSEEMQEMLTDVIKSITKEIDDAPNRLARTKEIVADPNKIMYMKLYLNKAHLSKDGVISADAEFSGNNARQVVAHEIQHLIQENEGFASGGTTRDMTYGEYRRLAGETEARNVSRRVDMPEYERRRSLASDTEDVPRERQTVRYTSKTSESNSSEVYTDLDGNEVYRETREDGTIEREITTMPDGSKRAEWFDKEGRIVKEQLDYYPNGEVRRVRNFDWNGLTREVEYDENRRITSYYLPAIGTDWKLDENGIARGKSNGVEIKPYNFQFSLKTYHGSGADFDRFNHDYVGSGEGNQAYGWGTYVTEVEGIGRRYAMIDYRRDGSRNHFLYSVEIPDEKEGKYLPYGERVSDPKVRKVLTDRLQQMADEYWNGEIPSYKLTELDKALNTFMPRDIASVLECSDKEVSQLLSKAGYTGVKYVANVFNRDQKGLSYNYVIFNEKDLGITDKEQFSLKREQTHSANFKRWFGDWENDPGNASKVVDAEGRPLVVYRGGEKINVFDRDKASRMAMYGPAFYATPSYADAQGFGKERTGNADNVQAVYLDIRNPWVDGPCESLGYPKEATMEQARELVDLLTSKGLVDGDIILAKWNDGRVRSLLGALADAKYEGVERGRGEFWHAGNIVQEALKELGYDGVVGRFDSGDGMVDQVAAFDPTQIKSATENNGDFSRENPDIRFSLKREDAEYQKAAESKYMWRSAARMLKKAAKAAMPDTKIVDENGDPLVVWHGSDTEFFIFDRDKIGTHSDEGYTGKGFYFAPRFEHADHYNRAKDGVTRKFYLNVTNPLIVTGQNANDSLIFGCDTLEEAKKKIWKYRAFFDGREAGAQKYIDELTQEKLDEINSHDGVWRQGTMDNGYYDEIVVKDSKQVKSADVALYDDNGNFIPLSERFNLENEDVRYSLKRRRNRDDYTDEDRADAAIIANTYLAQADALRQQIEADRQREHRLVEERNRLLAFDYPAADPADRPAIMDRINDLRNQINNLRNANYENNTKLRSMDYEYRVAKEILEQGAVTDEEAARFDAGQMTREEKVLESLFKAAADSRADKKAKQKAIRGLVRELTAITDNFKAAMKARGIESQRKHYDKGTVDHIIRLAKAMMGTGYIDNMTSYEVKRLMGMINNAATRESIETQAGRIVDMMLDHQIRTLRNDFNKQLKVTGQKTNSSGVQVQAGLDQEGQVVMEAMRKSMQIIADSAGERYDSNGYLTEWGEFYEKTLNDMGDADPVKAEQARKIFEGVWLASKWYEDVRAMEINGRILRSQMEDFKASNKPAKDADADTKQRYNDVLADYQEMLRQNKIKIIEAYERMTGDVGLTQADSMRRAKEFADAQKQRVNEIQHNANSDLADVDDNTQVETPESRVFGANKNNVLVRLLFASAGTYEKFMRFFGRMAPNGEGYLFKRFMTQYHHARQDYWKGRHSAFEEMDKKMAEVFGKKKMHWSDIYEMTRDHKKFPPITVSYWDGYRNGQPYLRMDELNQSEALYLYMINKMPDGRMKLRHMGITDDVVQQMAGQINNKLIQLADWLQSEFLPKMRIKYNETHKRVFGADMAAIEDYFPLRINKLAVASDMDITERDMNDNKPSTITGAIVKRRVNTLPIDLHTDAFDVALSHIDEMEHWSAYAEFNRDNNTLVNYKRFRTKVNNMRSLELGAGDVLWKNFTDAVAIAADAYHPRAGSRSGDHYSTRVAKFVSTAKIALRPYTALKQLLSIPAFWADSDPLEQMKATLNVADTWQWAIENLPGFAERWQSRQAGNIKLANYNDLSGLRRRKTMRKLQRAGMWANAAIDGLACAMGGKAVYETKYKRYLRMGYDEARAQEKALIDAAIAYNNSQQSSEGAYVSPLQVDRTWFANAFSVFRSASMGYTRRLNTSLRQLRNATFKPGYGAQSVEFLKKQMMRDGLTEEQAEKWAHRIYRRANLKAAASVAIFGQILPFAWNLGANMFYLLFGDDNKEKEGILADSFRHSFFGPVEGLTGGNVISELGDIAADTAIGNIWGDSVWGDSEAYKTLGYRDFSTMPLSSDLRNLLKYFARDEVKAANEVVNILFQVATGVNPQTITDWVTAILDFSRSDMERRDIAMFAMRLLSTPQQQLDKFYLDEMNISQEQASKMSVDDLIKRYATYKRWRETPLTGWMYSDEREKKVEEKFQKRYEEMLEERSVAEEGLRGTINDMKDLPRKRTMMQKLQKELTDSIEAADPDLYKKALEGEKADDDEYVRHVTDKDVEQMAELQMKKKALRAARDRKVKADKDAEAGRITQEEYDAIYEVCAHEWKLYNYLNNTLPKKLKEWKLKMEPDMQDKYTPEQVMDTIRSKTDKALQMRPEDMKLKKGDKKKVKKNKKK